ncbi:uncharacterized protein [Heterodontus francisci]|uniref:uncharacterized protein n=1 Tax=Heterodontus francisci TaxID=7792 RepID=UPI00355BF178
MNQNQLGPEPQTAHTPKPSASGGEGVHTCVTSPASSLAASPSVDLGTVQSVTCPGTYIQIPINAEVRCVSTLSLPMAVQQKIFGGTCKLPKDGDYSKCTSAIYICPVNPVKVTETKRLLPLVPKPLSLIRSAGDVTDPVLEKPTASLVAKMMSKAPSSRNQDTKMHKAGKEVTTTPTPVSVKFCNNLASQVLKTFVKHQAKGVSMDSWMQAYCNGPLDTKAGRSFKENALLLFNGQLYFLAQKGIEIPTGADKGRLSVRESEPHDQKVGPGGPGRLELSRCPGEPGRLELSRCPGEPGRLELSRCPGELGQLELSIETSPSPLSSSTTRQDVGSPEMRHELDTKGKECDVNRDNCLNPRGMDLAAHDTSLLPVKNGLDLAQKVVKQLPNSLPGSCARWPLLSKDRDLLLKAGIFADVRVCLYRISLIDLANSSGCWLESPITYIPKLSKEPDLEDLGICPEHSWESGPPELEQCPELIREHDPTEFRECPELLKEARLPDLGKGPDISRVPDSVGSKEPSLVIMEEDVAVSRVLMPAELEECPAISREPSQVALEECHDYSKKRVTITLEEDAYRAPTTAEFGGHSEPPLNTSSADLMDCLSESEEGFHNNFRRKRKEVEVVTQTSGCLNLDWTDQSVTAKRRKQHDLYSETSADSQIETFGDLNVGSPEGVDTENSLPIQPSCLEASSSLETNSLVAKEENNTSPPFHKLHPPEWENSAGLTSSNPLEVDETIRDEKINRLKEMLKEKQAVLDQMRKKISLSNTTSHSTLESFTL